MKIASYVYGRAVLGLFATVSLGLWQSPQAFAEEENTVSTIPDFFAEGRAYINGRYRYEYVDQDGISDDAKASTVRSRLGYETANLFGFKALVEVEDVTEIGKDLYNNTLNGRTSRPVVADVDGTEVNQAYLGYHGLSDTSVTFGRQRVVLDNARFVGDVGWRQNNQTFDSAVIANSSIPGLGLVYGYVLNVNRIFGDDSPVGDLDANVHLVNAKYTELPIGNLTAYAYLLDVDDAPAVSTTTFGARFDGKYGATDDLDVLYDLEYAFQSDYEDNPADYDVQYYRAELGAAGCGVTLKGGFESLGSDDGNAAFTTPLATLHAWNGWADKFLSTPVTGLQDAYGVLGYKVDAVNEIIDGTTLTVVYHYFSADEGSADYGTEWDFNIAREYLDHYLVGIKYANYDADDFATDTQKLILTLAASFSQ